MATPLTHTELLVLVAIARLEDAAYGVTIRQEIHDCACRQVSHAAIYAALDRLEQQGLARPWFSEPRPERGGRSRRHYGLTSAGRSLVRRERANAMRMWAGVLLEPRRTER